MQIAVFYFIYFAAQGCLVPYLPPYYISLGLSGGQLATLASIAPLIMVFAPPIWGFLADRSGKPARTLQLAMLGSAVFFVPMFFARTFAQLGAVLAIQGLFATTITSLADTVAVSEAQRIGTEYGRLRMWGSLGFVFGAYVFGAFLARGQGLEWVLFSGAAGLGVAALATFSLPQAKAVATHAVPSFRDALRLLRTGSFVAFLLTGTLHWAAMQSYYLLFALHIEERKLSPQFVGAGLTCGVVTEIILLFSFRRALQRVPLMPFLALAIVVSAGRWALTGWLTSGPAIAITQAVHGLSFGVFYAGSIAYLEQTTPSSLRATGRALLTSFSWGLGGILGNFCAGRLLDLGGTAAGYFGAAWLDLLALIPLAACLLLTRAENGAKRLNA
ncbi:MAG TPA: MFS transporter [Planctomycetota bacterium]|nr:MFS transporter [Planctomycetota bacterium]